MQRIQFLMLLLYRFVFLSFFFLFFFFRFFSSLIVQVGVSNLQNLWMSDDPFLLCDSQVENDRTGKLTRIGEENILQPLYL